MQRSGRFRKIMVVSLVALPLIGGFAHSAARNGPWRFGRIIIEQAWARISPADPKAASVYLTINNKSPNDDLLLAVESPAAQSSAVYANIATSGGAKLEAQPFGVSLPSQGEVALRPGGIQVVLKGVSGALKPGDTLPVRLVFRDMGPVELDVRVARPDEPDPALRHVGHKL